MKFTTHMVASAHSLTSTRDRSALVIGIVAGVVLAAFVIAEEILRRRGK